jgi:hypothetical protein
MLPSVKLLSVALLIALPACYHATIETGLPPSNEVLEQSFASSWIYGLVPPKPVSTMAKCPSGVSKVETQLSFVNQLVGLLTLGIYTPMAIKVTCATGRRSAIPGEPEIKVGDNPTDEGVIDAFRRAANLTVESGQPVYVRF